MSRERRPSATGLGQAAGVVLALIAAAAGITYLAHTAPTGELDPVAPTAGADDLTGDVIRCETPVPVAERFVDEEEQEEDDEEQTRPTNVEPVGRVLASEVVECPRHFDRLGVTYVGEVVGDVLHRRGGAWVLMNDDPYGLGSGPLGLTRTPSGTNSGLAVWLPEPYDELVTRPGRAGVRGDVLRVVGILHRIDPQDGGRLTIRAARVDIVAEAEPARQPFDPRRAVAGVALLALGAAVSVLERRHRLG